MEETQDQATQEPQESPEQTEQPQQEEVKESREDRRAKHDFLRFKHEARETQKQNEALQDKIRELEESKLAASSNYKELWQLKDTEVKELKQKIVQRDDLYFNSIKTKEIEKAAVELGLRPEAMEDLGLFDNSAVMTETTSQGNINVIGAKEYVESLKTKKPYLFKQQGPPNVNTGTPAYNTGKPITASELLALQQTDPAKYKAEIMKRVRGH
jgi:hypothetical protein